MKFMNVVVPRMYDTDNALVLSGDFATDIPHDVEPAEFFFLEFQAALAAWFETPDGKSVYKHLDKPFDLMDLDPETELDTDSFIDTMNSFGIFNLHIDETVYVDEVAA